MSDLLLSETIQVGDKSVNVATEHQYKSTNATEVSTYMYRRLYPLNEPVLATNGTSIAEFEIPPSQVFNLAKSFLDFDLVKDAPTANTNFNLFHNGFIAPIDSVELTDASGRQLVFLQNVPYMTKIMLRATTSYEDFITNPIHLAGQATVANVGQYRAGLLHKTDEAKTTNPSFYGAGVIATAGGTAGVPASDSFVGVSNWISGSAANTAVALRCSIPLSVFVGSLLAVNKDLYFGQTIRLRITFNQSKFMGFESLNQPTSGTQVAFTGNGSGVQITNDRLRLAVQSNPITEESIKKTVLTEGIDIFVPYTFSYKYTFSSGAGDQSLTRKINSSHGKNLLRIWTSPFNPNGEASGGSIYCQNYNVNNFMFSKVYSQLDGKNLQDSNLIVENGDLYTYLKNKIDGSAGGSIQQFQQSSYMLDDWCPWKTTDYINGDLSAQGLSLAEERQYDITFTLTQLNGGVGNATAINSSLFYMFVVCQRILSITREGVRFG